MEKKRAGEFAVMEMRAKEDSEHNMWAFEDVKGKRAWIMCATCDSERQVSLSQLENFVTSIGCSDRVHFMGLVRYHGG